MKVLLLPLVLFALATTAGATEIAKGYRCIAGQKPEGLIRKLIETKTIDDRPFEDVDGIPLFAVRPGYTAFGLPFMAVSAWQPDSKLFTRGPGTAPTRQYTFVVRANLWELAQAVKTYGVKVANAKGQNDFPYVALRAYNSEYQESLPSGADSRLSYSQITCDLGY